MISRSIHLAANGIILFFFYDWVISHYIYVPCCLYTAYIWVLFLYPFSHHLVNLHLRQLWYTCSECHFVNFFRFVFVGLFSSLLLFSSLVVWWLTLVLCFYYLCVSIADFWFAVMIRMWYRSLYIYKIVLSWWPFNCKCIFRILHLYPLLVESLNLLFLC